MDNTQTTLDIPCPSCATFSLVDDQQLLCQHCGSRTRKRPLKTALDYAEYVYRFGHQYRQTYEIQLENDGNIKPVDSLPKPSPLHTYITLALLSGVVGKSAWFLVKAAVIQLVASYNEKYQGEIIVTEDDMREMNKHFREFTNSFADVDTRIRNSVFEAIFAHECNRKDADRLLKLRIKAAKAKGTQKQDLENQAEKFLESMMRATFKKVSKRPKPTPEELSAYWQKIFG